MLTAIISKKGGVGKTTTSVNLAAALARVGQRVLLIDMDANAGASLSVGLTKDQLGPGVSDVMLRGVAPRLAVRPTELPNLWIMPASVDLRSAEIELDRLSAKERVLERKLESIRHDFDHIILDCPPALGILAQNAIAAADGFLIPAMPQFLALEGLDHLVATAERLQVRLGKKPRCLGFVLTAVDYRLRITHDTVERLRARFGSLIFAVEIRINSSLAEAPAYGQTIFQYRPQSVGARCHLLLAEEFLMRTGSVAPLAAAV
jgi:chromosome partitioning protein